MGYHTSNAAYAYDMRPDVYEGHATAPAQSSRPRLDVVSGAGRETSQDVSPQFTHCVKLFAVLAVMFVALGLFRVTLAGCSSRSVSSA